MNVLVTSARMPFALDEIRKLGRCGHRVVAADSIRTAPGSHSRWAAEHVRVAPPQYEPLRFLGDVKQIIYSYQIDLLVPCFEEVFYLARHLPELSEVTQVLASPFPVIAGLHDKMAFNALARDIGLRAPPAERVCSRDELVAATREHRWFVARPVCSRGGLDLYTNAGPLAGAMTLETCTPSNAHPWIVQEYVDGRDVCSFSIAQHGRVVAHCTYVHPLEIEHGGGIVFESIEDPETLEPVQRIVEATGYHGQLGLDFRRDDRGLQLIECNPRPTAGVHMYPDQLLVDALLDQDGAKVRLVPAGVQRLYASAVLRDLMLHLSHLRTDAALLVSRHVLDVMGEPGDRLPAVYQALSYAHVLSYRAHGHRPARAGTSLMAAYFDGIAWDGDAIP